jgi:ABC-type molybdenum transport system ATPase subunit/photorepair protein PhrA
MKEKYFILLFILIFQSTNTIAWSKEIESATFVISNEAPGYLIDNLIKQGYGDSSLYAVTKHLQPLSGGVIPQWFMDSLSACPANSDVFTAKLFNFSSPFNNPIGIGTDGNLIVAQIYGTDFLGKEGYLNYIDTLGQVNHKLFTKAKEPKYYIDAGSKTYQTSSGYLTTYYKAFAIAWSTQPTTFVITNEAPGYLIDNLIKQGYGDSCLYAVTKHLQPLSGGAIPQWFIDSLSACPAGSQIFTDHLSSYSGINNPVGINTDGTLIITPIYGKDYFGKVGYKTYPESIVDGGGELFTYAISPEYIIDTGSSIDSDSSSGIGTYQAFAIGWAQAILSVSPNTLNIAAANGSTASFNVTSNINWTVASNQTWLSVNPSNGSGNGTVTLTAEANPTISARTATVTLSGKDVKSQTVTVTQSPGEAILTVSPANIDIAPTAGDTTITITSNTDWTVASNQTWLSVNPSNGSGNGTVTLTAEANTTSARNAIVTISGKGVNSQTISVHQFGTIGVIDNDLDFIVISPLPAENKLIVRNLFALGDIFEYKFFDLDCFRR